MGYMFDEAESVKGDGTPADRSRADTCHSTALTAPMAEVVELATMRHRIDVREAELLDVLFNRTLDTHQTMFAMGEAIAHLNYLEQAGRLSRSIDADGVIRYSRLQH